MSEIDPSNIPGIELSKDKKSKKADEEEKAEKKEEAEQQPEEDFVALDSEEVGKYFTSHKLIMMNTLSLPLKSP